MYQIYDKFVPYGKYLRTCCEINLGNVIYNLESMKRIIGQNTGIYAVIKSNAYGHGDVPIALEAEKLPYVRGFAVATFEEAAKLRDAGIKKDILLLGSIFPYCYAELINNDITATIFQKDKADLLSEMAEKLGTKARVHIKVDTGMSRIGLGCDDAGLDIVRHMARKPGLDIRGIFSHFYAADSRDLTSAQRQEERFFSFVGRIENELGLSIPLKHICNSAGIVAMPSNRLDIVRAGIILYGLRPSDELDMSAIDLKPVMSWYSHIIYTKWIEKGTVVSYGATFTAEKRMRIATIPVGYADGYPRSLSGKGHVLIRGRKAPIIGRICMDQFLADISDIDDAGEGDRVTLIGTDGEETVSAEYLGELSGRFNYELVCDISERVPRVYVRSSN